MSRVTLTVSKYELTSVLTLKCDWFHLALVMWNAAVGALFLESWAHLTKLMQPAARAAGPVCPFVEIPWRARMTEDKLNAGFLFQYLSKAKIMSIYAPGFGRKPIYKGRE